MLILYLKKIFVSLVLINALMIGRMKVS